MTQWNRGLPLFKRLSHARRVRARTMRRTAWGFLSLVVVGTWGASCASVAGPPAQDATASQGRYPRRASGCELAIYYTAVPGVPAWDDLGVAEAACHINDPVAECLRRLRSEACQLGGDILYNVPRQPLRPRDQVLVYRAQVAHSRSRAAQKVEDPDLPPPASAEELAAPVVPLPMGPPRTAAPPAVPAPVDVPNNVPGNVPGSVPGSVP